MADNMSQLTEEQRAKVEDPDQLDETVPGGRYIVGDRVVNAHGEDLGAAAKSDLKVEAPEAQPTPQPVVMQPAKAAPTTKKGR
jgi:hypothetical protein